MQCWRWRRRWRWLSGRVQIWWTWCGCNISCRVCSTSSTTSARPKCLLTTNDRVLSHRSTSLHGEQHLDVLANVDWRHARLQLMWHYCATLASAALRCPDIQWSRDFVCFWLEIWFRFYYDSCRLSFSALTLDTVGRASGRVSGL